MTRASSLFRLQQLDSEIDAVIARREQIDAALGGEQGLAEAHSALGVAQAALAATRTSVRALEGDVQSLAAKAAEVEQSLYSGRVSNPKELQNLQEELESLKRRRSVLEDQQLESMVQAEGDEAAEHTARMRLGEVQAMLKASRAELQAEREVVSTALKRLALDREAAESPVSPADRQTYQSLRRRKRGMAVARLQDGSCSACGVAPSSSRAQSAGHDELIFCGNCERVLYAG